MEIVCQIVTRCPFLAEAIYSNVTRACTEHSSNHANFRLIWDESVQQKNTCIVSRCPSLFKYGIYFRMRTARVTARPTSHSFPIIIGWTRHPLVSRCHPPQCGTAQFLPQFAHCFLSLPVFKSNEFFMASQPAQSAGRSTSTCPQWYLPQP